MLGDVPAFFQLMSSSKSSWARGADLSEMPQLLAKTSTTLKFGVETPSQLKFTNTKP